MGEITFSKNYEGIEDGKRIPDSTVSTAENQINQLVSSDEQANSRWDQPYVPQNDNQLQANKAIGLQAGDIVQVWVGRVVSTGVFRNFLDDCKTERLQMCAVDIGTSVVTAIRPNVYTIAERGRLLNDIENTRDTLLFLRSLYSEEVQHG